MRLIPALLLSVLAACENPFAPEPPIPGDAVEMRSIPSLYAYWWEEVLTDTGLSAEMSGIRFYRVPGGPWPDRSGQEISGLWVKKGRRIYLSERHIYNPSTVRHEMLHEVLGRADHEHPLFGTARY